MFSPLAFPNGRMFYDMTTSVPSSAQIALAPFELFRRPLVVLAIADAAEYADSPSSDVGEVEELSRDTLANGQSPKQGLEAVMEYVQDFHPEALLTQLVVMDYVKGSNSSWLPSDAICVPPLKLSTSTTIKTVMCDISSKLLAELSIYAREVREQSTVQVPVTLSKPSHGSGNDQSSGVARQSSLRSQGSRTESPAPGANRDSTVSHTSSPPPRGPVESRPTSPETRIGPPTSFDEIANTAMTGDVSRSDSRASRSEVRRPDSHDRGVTHSQGPSSIAERNRNVGKARVGLVLGQMYLLAGHWSEAWREFLEHTTKARSLGDHLWHAKGLECIVICMILFAWGGFEFQVSICSDQVQPSRS